MNEQHDKLNLEGRRVEIKNLKEGATLYGTFIRWVDDPEEDERGFTPFTSAAILMDDGQVGVVVPRMIRFLDPAEQAQDDLKVAERLIAERDIWVPWATYKATTDGRGKVLSGPDLLSLGKETIPVELFDGNAVYYAMTEPEKSRTSPENVCDAMNGIGRLINANAERGPS